MLDVPAALLAHACLYGRIIGSIFEEVKIECRYLILFFNKENEVLSCENWRAMKFSSIILSKSRNTGFLVIYTMQFLSKHWLN